MEFCDWIGARLPTEDEWYKEASNNSSRNYPWGDTPQASCTHAVMENTSGEDGCGMYSTGPVCSKPLGNSVNEACDMSGNVWEWTATAWGGSIMHIRGGSYQVPVNRQDAVQTSGLAYHQKTKMLTGLGFRCANDSVIPLPGFRIHWPHLSPKTKIEIESILFS